MKMGTMISTLGKASFLLTHHYLEWFIFDKLLIFLGSRPLLIEQIQKLE